MMIPGALKRYYYTTSGFDPSEGKTHSQGENHPVENHGDLRNSAAVSQVFIH
jgi:hypothetical protein